MNRRIWKGFARYAICSRMTKKNEMFLRKHWIEPPFSYLFSCLRKELFWNMVSGEGVKMTSCFKGLVACCNELAELAILVYATLARCFNGWRLWMAFVMDMILGSYMRDSLVGVNALWWVPKLKIKLTEFLIGSRAMRWKGVMIHDLLTFIAYNITIKFRQKSLTI